MSDFDELLAGLDDDDESVDSMISGLAGDDPPAPVASPRDESADELVASFTPPEPEGGGATTPPEPVTQPDDGVPRWLAALSGQGAYGDPISNAMLGSIQADPTGAPKAAAGMAAGGLHGATFGADRAADMLADDLGLAPDSAVRSVTRPIRDWSIESERGSPGAFGMANALGSVVSPANKIGNVTRGLAGTARVVGDVAAQAGLGMAENSLDEYGSTGSLPSRFSNWITGLLSGALALPGAAVSGAASKTASRARDPERQLLRGDLQRDERLMSFGATPTEIDGLAKTDKYEDVLAEAERIAAANGGGARTVPELGLGAKKAVSESADLKDAAATYMADDGVQMQPENVAQFMRDKIRELHPNAAAGLPEGKAIVEGADARARLYDEKMPRRQPQPIGVENPELPPPPLPAGPLDAAPPPLPPSSPEDAAISALATPDPIQTPPAVAEILESAPPMAADDAAISALASQATPPPAATQSIPLDDIGAEDVYQSLSPDDMIEARPSAMRPPAPAPAPPPLPVEAPPPGSWADNPRIDAIQAATPPAANPGMPTSLAGAPGAQLPAGPPGRPNARAQAPAWNARPDLAPFAAAPVPEPVPLPPGPAWDSRPELDPFRASPEAAPAAPPPGPAWDQRIDALQENVAPTNTGMSGMGAAPLPPIPAHTPDDAIGALAQAGQTPGPSPWQERSDIDALQSTAGGPDDAYFMGAAGSGRPEMGPAPVRFDHFNQELRDVGRQLDPTVVPPTAANEYKPLTYAAINSSMEDAARGVDPALGQQWAGMKAREGNDHILSDWANRAQNREKRPFFNRQDFGLGGALAPAGAALGYGVDSLTGNGNDKNGWGREAGALAGLAGGIATGRWYQPRQHSIQANWLNKDSAAMLDRVANFAGGLPTGAAVASAKDAYRPAGYTSGQLLGRRTSAAMLANSSMFMPWAESFQKAQTDDKRAAVVEGLLRTDQGRFQPVYDFINSQKNIASNEPGGP